MPVEFDCGLTVLASNGFSCGRLVVSVLLTVLNLDLA